jgi:hypothetical protein
LPAVSLDVDWVALVVAVVLAIAAPPIGFVLSLYWATQRYRAGESLMPWLMLASAAVAVAAFLAPMWFWSHLL